MLCHHMIIFKMLRPYILILLCFDIIIPMLNFLHVITYTYRFVAVSLLVLFSCFFVLVCSV